MTINRSTRRLRTILVIAVAVAASCLALGMGAPPRFQPPAPGAGPAPAPGPTVTCLPFGLCGDIITRPVTGRLSDAGEDLTFVGTSNGLYVVRPGGALHHFLYTPFGVRHIALVRDVTGDSVREVVVALNDTRVPALRCYDGASWEEVWRYAPMARIWDRLWVDRQEAISDLGVTAEGGPQSVLVTSGRCALSVGAADGAEQWRFTASSAVRRMAVLNGLEGGGGVLAGTDGGGLFWLDSRTGQAQWRTELPGRAGTMHGGMERLVSDIAVLDEASGKVVVASADGYAQGYDLPGKRREWRTRAFGDDSGGRYDDYYPGTEVVMSVAPDISGDGLPEVLLSEAYFGQERAWAAYAQGRTSLCDSAGNVVWEKSSLAYPPTGLEAGEVDGRPFFLQSDGDVVRLTDLKDGHSVLRTVPLDGLADPYQSLVMREPAWDGYLAASSGTDLTALSGSGAVLWSCPRLGNVISQAGDFVGDSAPDVLFCAQRPGSTPYDGNARPFRSGEGTSFIDMSYTMGVYAEEPDARLLAMMDGATRTIAWSYEVPYRELGTAGGLKGLRVVPDLVGNDAVPDIVGYRGDTVFILSGRSGSLTTVPAGMPISALEVLRHGAAGNVLALATSSAGGPGPGAAGGLLIADPAGAPLWSTTTAEWLGDDAVSGIIGLDDLNADNVSELALVSASRVAVLRSEAATDNYQKHFTIEARAGYYLSRVEQVPDSDGDGARDLACIQQGRTDQWAPAAPAAAPLLALRSTADGEKLFEVGLPAYWTACDLACGDFDGDGCADSMFVSPGDEAAGLTLRLLSGRDGSTLRAHVIETDYFGVPRAAAPPAVSIGDADGDGADDLAYASTPGGTYGPLPESGYAYTPAEDQRLRVWVYSPARDEMLKSFPVTTATQVGYYGGLSPAPLLAADVDGDGRPEVVVDVPEPNLPPYGAGGNDIYWDGTSVPNIAIADLEAGRRLAGFTGFDASAMSVFETCQPGSLGVAASGAAFFLRADAGLEVTSPGNGARTGPDIAVSWEGPAGGDFTQVLVDGVCYEMAAGTGASLYLGRGEHDIAVRSIDDWGRISYAPADLGSPVTVTVSPSPWRAVWLAVSLLALAAVALALSYARLHRAWRARMRAAK